MSTPLKHFDLPRTTLSVLFIVGLLSAALWILRPFIPALIWATMVVVATWPLMRKVQEKLWHKRWLAVVVMTIAMLLIFVVPLTLAVDAVVSNAGQMAGWAQDLAMVQLPQPPDWLGSIPIVGEKAASVWRDIADSGPKELAKRVAPYAHEAAQWFALQVQRGGAGRASHTRRRHGGSGDGRRAEPVRGDRLGRRWDTPCGRFDRLDLHAVHRPDWPGAGAHWCCGVALLEGQLGVGDRPAGVVAVRRQHGQFPAPLPHQDGGGSAFAAHLRRGDRRFAGLRPGGYFRRSAGARRHLHPHVGLDGAGPSRRGAGSRRFRIKLYGTAVGWSRRRLIAQRLILVILEPWTPMPAIRPFWSKMMA